MKNHKNTIFNIYLKADDFNEFYRHCLTLFSIKSLFTMIINRYWIDMKPKIHLQSVFHV